MTNPLKIVYREITPPALNRILVASAKAARAGAERASVYHQAGKNAVKAKYKKTKENPKEQLPATISPSQNPGQ